MMLSATPSAASRHRHRHPVNVAHLDEAPLGARIADRATAFIGSWFFIAIQTAIALIWIGGNVYLIFNFDPYPFILLNLAFGTLAAYSGPLILLAGNRQEARDRLTLEHAAEETDFAEKQNEQLLRGNAEILDRIERLEHLILELEGRILERLPAGG